MSAVEIDRGDRLHGLDALRGGALLLGVVLHASMSYLPVTVWIVPDEQTSPVAGALFFAIHLFRMTTFFLIAGLFGHMLLQRRGWLGFAKDRLSRIAGPLAAFWGLVLGAIIAVLLWKVAHDNGGVLPTDGPPPPPLTVETFPWTHLWFLWLLLIFYAVLLIGRGVLALDRGGGVARLADRAAGLVIGPWTPALLAAPLALAFWAMPQWYAFFGIPTPDTGVVPNGVALLAFGMAFAVGVLLDRRRDLLKRIEQSWAPMLGAALLSGAAAFYLTGGWAPKLEPMADGSMKGVAAWTYALAVYAATFAVIGLALRFASGRSAVRRYLADSSYWVYIVHLPLVMVGQMLVLDLAWPWFAKLGVVAGGVLAISLLTYELLVRHSFIGKWLNGRRVPWRKPAPPPVLAPAE